MSAVRPAPVLFVAALALLAALAPALAQEDEPDATLEGHEGPDCPVTELTFVCFTGDTTGLEAALIEGATVSIAFTAAGDAPHNINVINESDAADAPVSTSGELGTAAADAIASSDEVASGASTVFTFTVPVGSTSLYFWCDVGEHELAGMNFALDVTAAPAPANDTDNETGGNETGTNNTTLPPGDDSGGNSTAPPSNAGGLDDVDNDNPAANNTTADDTVDEDTPAPGVFVTLATLGAIMVAARRRRLA